MLPVLGHLHALLAVPAKQIHLHMILACADPAAKERQRERREKHKLLGSLLAPFLSFSSALNVLHFVVRFYSVVRSIHCYDMNILSTFSTVF